MIDVHSHILPLVDDGSQSFELSIDLIKEEIKQGVTHIVLTPHIFGKEQKSNRAFQIEQFNKLKEMTKDLPITLILGAEIYYRPHFDLELHRYAFEDTNIILMEFSTVHKTAIEDIVFNIQAKGYQVIVAHVERYLYLTKEDIINIKKTGALLQVNSSAIVGPDKYTKKSMVNMLIRNKFIDIIATDTHNLDVRKPLMQQAFIKLKKYYSQEELYLLFNRINFIKKED